MSLLGGCLEVAEKGEIANSDISRDVEQNMMIFEVFEGVYGRACHIFLAHVYANRANPKGQGCFRPAECTGPLGGI